MKRWIALVLMAAYGLYMGAVAERPNDAEAQQPPAGWKTNAVAADPRGVPIEQVDGSWWQEYTPRERHVLTLGFQLGVYAAAHFLDEAAGGGTNFKGLLLPNGTTSLIMNATTALYEEVPEGVPLFLVMMNAYNPPLIEDRRTMEGGM